MKLKLVDLFRHPEFFPLYLTSFAIYGLFFVIFLGLATAGLGYRFAASQVVPMTLISQLKTCRYHNTEPKRQNRNSKSYDFSCDDTQQAERMNKLGFIYVRPVSLKLNLRHTASPVFETQILMYRLPKEDFRVGQILQVRLAKLRNQESAELASEPPLYRGFLSFFLTALALFAFASLMVGLQWVRAKRSKRKSEFHTNSIT